MNNVSETEGVFLLCYILIKKITPINIQLSTYDSVILNHKQVITIIDMFKIYSDPYCFYICGGVMPNLNNR